MRFSFHGRLGLCAEKQVFRNNPRKPLKAGQFSPQPCQHTQAFSYLSHNLLQLTPPGRSQWRRHKHRRETTVTASLSDSQHQSNPTAQRHHHTDNFSTNTTVLTKGRQGAPPNTAQAFAKAITKSPWQTRPQKFLNPSKQGMCEFVYREPVLN